MRFFTEKARAAAAAGRRRHLEERAANKAQIEVFAVRRGVAISWEVRQFGGVVLYRGTECFDSSAAAVAAGERARRAWVEEPEPASAR